MFKLFKTYILYLKKLKLDIIDNNCIFIIEGKNQTKELMKRTT